MRQAGNRQAISGLKSPSARSDAWMFQRGVYVQVWGRRAENPRVRKSDETPHGARSIGGGLGGSLALFSAGAGRKNPHLQLITFRVSQTAKMWHTTGYVRVVASHWRRNKEEKDRSGARAQSPYLPPVRRVTEKAFVVRKS